MPCIGLFFSYFGSPSFCCLHCTWGLPFGVLYGFLARLWFIFPESYNFRPGIAGVAFEAITVRVLLRWLVLSLGMKLLRRNVTRAAQQPPVQSQKSACIWPCSVHLPSSSPSYGWHGPHGYRNHHGRLWVMRAVWIRQCLRRHLHSYSMWLMVSNSMPAVRWRVGL